MNYYKSVFEYDDPVLFIQERIKASKLTPKGLSLRQLSKMLKLKSSSQLSEVFSKKRPFHLKLADQIGRQLKLNEKEQEYFLRLVLLRNSQDPTEKQYHEIQLQRLITGLGRKNVNVSNVEQFNLISDIFAMGVLESLSLSSEAQSLYEIHRKLKFTSTLEHLTATLSALEKAQLVVKNEELYSRKSSDGFLVPSSKNSFSVQHFHKSSMDLAKESITSQKTTERNLRASVVSIKKENYKKVVDLICQFHDSLMNLSTSTNADMSLIINSQAFIFSEKSKR